MLFLSTDWIFWMALCYYKMRPSSGLRGGGAGQVRRDEFLLSKGILCGDSPAPLFTTNMRPERNIFDWVLVIYFR